VLDGIEGQIAEGEVYRGSRLSPAAMVLLTADDGCGPAPVAWTARHAGGRVFCTTLGHEDDFREPAFLRLLARAVRWTAMVRRM
jgi:type 1 glutamine amidotransferase